MTGICCGCLTSVNPPNRANLMLKQYVRRTRCSCCRQLKLALWQIPRLRRLRRVIRHVFFDMPMTLLEIPEAEPRVRHEDYNMTSRPDVYTYVLDEECVICYGKDDNGHRQCLQCNGSCCSSCWSRIDKCPVCRCDK